jgi:hypothetical protein
MYNKSTSDGRISAGDVIVDRDGNRYEVQGIVPYYDNTTGRRKDSAYAIPVINRGPHRLGRDRVVLRQLHTFYVEGETPGRSGVRMLPDGDWEMASEADFLHRDDGWEGL